jgi:hypothetical protein
VKSRTCLRELRKCLASYLSNGPRQTSSLVTTGVEMRKPSSPHRAYALSGRQTSCPDITPSGESEQRQGGDRPQLGEATGRRRHLRRPGHADCRSFDKGGFRSSRRHDASLRLDRQKFTVTIRGRMTIMRSGKVRDILVSRVTAESTGTREAAS